MAQVSIGEGGQVVLGGYIAELDLQKVQTRLLDGAVDLSTLCSSEGPVSQLRSMAGSITSPEDPAWTSAVDSLYGEVDAVKQAIGAVDMSNLIETGEGIIVDERRAGPAIINKSYIAPQVSRNPKDGSNSLKAIPLRTDGELAFASRYAFLAKGALLALGKELPQRRKRPVEGEQAAFDQADVRSLAVRIHLKADLPADDPDFAASLSTRPRFTGFLAGY